MAKTTKQHAHELITVFLNEYAKRFGGTRPRGLNRHALSYGFESFYKDYGPQAREIISYYVNNYESPDPTAFCYKYGDVAEAMEEERRDAEERNEQWRKTVEIIQNRRKIVTDSSKGDRVSDSE